MSKTKSLLLAVAVAAMAFTFSCSSGGGDDGTGGGGGGGGTMSTARPLTENKWADGNLPKSSSVQWFTFTATASTQYIHVEFGTLKELYMQVYDINGTKLEDEYISEFISIYSHTPLSLTAGQTYYIEVDPYGSSGTYRIAFNASAKEPFEPPNPIQLTENRWANGNLPKSLNSQQWFSFTATAETQYIHVEYGTLEELDMRVYDGSGTMLESNSYSYNLYTPLTIGQTYYIEAFPRYSMIDGGTYQIAFNASTTAPTR